MSLQFGINDKNSSCNKGYKLALYIAGIRGFQIQLLMTTSRRRKETGGHIYFALKNPCDIITGEKIRERLNRIQNS